MRDDSTPKPITDADLAAIGANIADFDAANYCPDAVSARRIRDIMLAGQEETALETTAAAALDIAENRDATRELLNIALKMIAVRDRAIADLRDRLRKSEVLS
jgi:hypothetical protein